MNIVLTEYVRFENINDKFMFIAIPVCFIDFWIYKMWRLKHDHKLKLETMEREREIYERKQSFDLANINQIFKEEKGNGIRKITVGDFEGELYPPKSDI